jgi:tetratricopeptide (TPR) repeat protein
MALLVLNRPYDRRKFLDQAAKATRGRSRRKRRRAIALYREVLQREPDDPDLHRKLAELLAKDGELQAAKSSYRLACDGYSKRGFSDRTIGVLRDAVRRIPREVDFWLELARLEFERGRRIDSVTVLREGRRRFRHRKGRPEALKLLTAASKIAPSDLDIGLDFALQLKRAGMKRGAVRVLDRLPVQNRNALRRVRGRQLRVDFRVGTAIRYLRALVQGR